MRIILVVLVGFMVACSEQGVELTDPVPLSTELQTTKGKVVGNARESDLLEFLGMRLLDFALLLQVFFYL